MLLPNIVNFQSRPFTNRGQSFSIGTFVGKISFAALITKNSGFLMTGMTHLLNLLLLFLSTSELIPLGLSFQSTVQRWTYGV